MFRAINRRFLTVSALHPTTPLGRPHYFVEGRNTLRAPSNVSFLADNAWELIRLINNPFAPSRRVSAFASPTKAQALESAVNTDAEVFKVVFKNVDPLVSVLHGYCDAKLHPDIKMLQRAFAKQATSDQGFTGKEHLIADLFGPFGFKCVPVWQDNDEDFVLSLLEKVTFWKDIEVIPFSKVDPHNENCEIWFDQTNGYWLEEV